MRSGVNWMRLKEASRDAASARAKSVLARPGTPSRMTWPPAKQRDERLFNQRFLADDDLADFLPEISAARVAKQCVHTMADLISIRSRATRSQPVGGKPST